jgi:hypothetical protein
MAMHSPSPGRPRPPGVTEEVRPDAVVVRLSDQLDSDTAPLLAQALAGHLRGRSAVLVDASASTSSTAPACVC